MSVVNRGQFSRSLVVAAVVICVMGWQSVASAQSVDCRDDPTQDFCAGQTVEVPGNQNQTPTPGPVDLPPLTYRIVVGYEADGTACVNLVAQWVEGPLGTFVSPAQAAEIRSRLAAGEEYMSPDFQTDFPIMGALSLPLCENDGAGVDVQGLAQSVWVGLEIQAPAAKVAPGYMLTGLTSYLELDAPEQLTASETLPDGLGTLRITATPEHHIDWDDGGATTVTTDTGVPYPGGPGEITHVYNTAAERTVTITTHWTGTFSGPGFTDEPLGTRVAETTNLPLDVRQWQAVRIFN